MRWESWKLPDRPVFARNPELESLEKNFIEEAN
jgi:hypothetical protein